MSRVKPHGRVGPLGAIILFAVLCGFGGWLIGFDPGISALAGLGFGVFLVVVSAAMQNAA